MIDPTSVLATLLESRPVSLAAVPTGPGIYGLYDHRSEPRYIGITARCLHDRIYTRHAAGDGNSHKFSSAYNAGRMFHSRNNPASCAQDGPVAKELRRLFARTFCSAVAIPIPGATTAQLLSIESAVLALAPQSATSWNNERALAAVEPEGLIDALLGELIWPAAKLDAIDRQARRWRESERH